jgi:hypothetical protein
LEISSYLPGSRKKPRKALGITSAAIAAPQFEAFYKPFITAITNQKFIGYRSPSWSWALVGGLVTFLYANGYGDIVLDIISCHVELDNDSSPIGRVK